MDFQNNIPLARYASFLIGGPARLFCRVKTLGELRQAIERAKQEHLPILLIGGSSNLLISDRGFDGLVIKLEITGITSAEANGDILLHCSAGERWDDVATLAAERGWWGIENLSHIPGSVGAFAVQNVGAYGQEASQVVEWVRALDLTDNTIKLLFNSECGFAYRKSIFNTTQKGRYIILQTALRLHPGGRPNLSYADVQAYFTQRGISQPTLSQIRAAIIEIRNKKFTTPDKIPNAGSFFKNLVISETDFEFLSKKIKENFNDVILDKLQNYRARLSGPEGIKIPTAFLIDLCGLKGARVDGAKINETQPLVLLNYSGTATAHDVLSLMKQVRQTVYARTGMKLDLEPELVGFSEAELKNYFAL